MVGNQTSNRLNFAIASQAFAAGTVILRATVVFVCVIFSVVWSTRIALTRFACPLWVQKATFACVQAMSAVTPTSDIDQRVFDVRFVPKLTRVSRAATAAVSRAAACKALAFLKSSMSEG